METIAPVKSIKISEISQISVNRIEALFEFPNQEPQRIFIESSKQLESNADTWLLLALPIGMKLGLPIEIDGEIDSLLSENLENLEHEYLRGNRKFKRIEVLAKGTKINSPIASM